MTVVFPAAYRREQLNIMRVQALAQLLTDRMDKDAMLLLGYAVSRLAELDAEPKMMVVMSAAEYHHRLLPLHDPEDDCA